LRGYARNAGSVTRRSIARAWRRSTRTNSFSALTKSKPSSIPIAIVTSPLEVATVRSITGPAAILVTPGVRSAGKALGDQKRVATPGEAIRNGADYLVMGRQITRAADPKAEAARVLEEIEEARSLTSSI